MSIKHNPPHGSQLAVLVDRLVAMADEPTWASDDDVIRVVGELHVMQSEPRIWKWPRRVFKDRIVLPLIEQRDGSAGADAFRRAPQALDHYADLLANRFERDAAAHERIAPKASTAWIVEVIVLAAINNHFDPRRSYNAVFNETAKQLGVNRAAVRRIFLAKTSRMLITPDGRAALKAVSDLLGLDRPMPVVRNRHAAFALSSHKSTVHAEP